VLTGSGIRLTFAFAAHFALTLWTRQRNCIENVSSRVRYCKTRLLVAVPVIAANTRRCSSAIVHCSTNNVFSDDSGESLELLPPSLRAPLSDMKKQRWRQTGRGNCRIGCNVQAGLEKLVNDTMPMR